jgi:hypothetical protein
MTYEAIRDQFNVPARRGARVLVNGQPGAVTSVRGFVLRVKLDGGTYSRPFHPRELQWVLDAAEERQEPDIETASPRLPHQGDFHEGAPSPLPSPWHRPRSRPPACR